MKKAFVLKNKETGKLMVMSCTSWENGEQSGAEFSWEEMSEKETSHLVWVTFRKEIAEKAAIMDGRGWKNNQETARNDFVGKLEVIEIEIG